MKPTPELTARVARAKAGELQDRLLQVAPGDWGEMDWLRADLALLFDLLADHLERATS